MAGRCRSDQRWIKEHGSGVYIEHENRCDAKIDGEIQKLCNDVSKLKVLITTSVTRILMITSDNLLRESELQ